MTAPTALAVPRLIDTHAHLQDPSIAEALPAVLSRAADAGVGRILAIGTTAADSLEVIEVARRNPGVFAAVGVQPNHVAEAVEGDWERIVELAGHPEVRAIGETGLDRYWDYTPFEQQVDWFDRHLQLADARGLPVVIHCRECEADIIEQLGRLGRPVRGVLHSFTGNWDHAQAFLALGLHLSFAGMVTYTSKKLDPLREVARRVPLDRLLVETDSPYLSPHPHRGQRNEPARVAVTAAFLARIREMPLDALITATTANACGLFGLDGAPTLVATPSRFA
ncbi:MAG: TatD family hydrolase [Isosphaeraceae bacterium]